MRAWADRRIGARMNEGEFRGDEQVRAFVEWWRARTGSLLSIPRKPMRRSATSWKGVSGGCLVQCVERNLSHD